MFARAPFTHFPDETVVVKMEHSGGGYDSGQDPLHCINFDETGIDEGKRTVGKDQANIKADERPAAAENETHEATDRSIFLNPTAIVNPDNREVLHIVKHLEER